MRFILIDPLLKNSSGHCHFYDKAVADELEKRGIAVVIFGNRAAQHLCPGLRFFPLLDDLTQSFFRNRPGFGAFALLGGMRAYTRRLEAAFFRNPDFRLEDGDVLFVPTAYIFELLGLAAFFFKTRKLFRRSRASLKVVLRFRYIRESAVGTGMLAFLHRVCHGVFARVFGKRLAYFTDSRLLEKEFAALLGARIRVLPIPLYPLPETPAGVSSSRRLVVSSLGGARFNKGFDIFVDAVRRLAQDAQMKQFLSFAAQIDIHPQPESERRRVAAAAAALRELSEKTDNIRIIEGNLDSRAYYSLLNESDIVVLAYRGEAYRSATANILVEAVLAGKVPVVSADTWMAHELRRCGLSGLVFRNGSAEALAGKIGEVVRDYVRYGQEIARVRQEWRRYHSAANLADILTEVQPDA